MIANTKIKDNETWQSSVIIINLHWEFIDLARTAAANNLCVRRWQRFVYYLLFQQLNHMFHIPVDTC